MTIHVYFIIVFVYEDKVFSLLSIDAICDRAINTIEIIVAIIRMIVQRCSLYSVLNRMKQVNMKIVDENNEIHCVSLNFFGSLALLFGIFVLMIATQTINVRAKIITGCFFFFFCPAE